MCMLSRADENLAHVGSRSKPKQDKIHSLVVGSVPIQNEAMILLIRQILGPVPRVWNTRVEKVENSLDIAIEVMGTVPRAGQ